MKIIPFIVLILSLHMTYASALTLQAILHEAEQHNTLTKALDQQALASKSQALVDTANTPLSLYAEGVRAVPNTSVWGYEYTVGISKNIKLGNIQNEERNMILLQSEASRLEGEKKVILFNNTIKNIYHQHCVDVQRYSSIKQNYQDFLSLYTKKEKAYKYHEISKTELMQLKSEKRRLFVQVENMKMAQNSSKQKILILSGLNNTKHVQLACNDIYPIRSQITLNDTFRLSTQAKEKRLESTQKALKRYSHTIDSFDINGQYGKELDIDRYTIGVSIPLNFTTSKNEYARAAAMYKASEIAYRYEQSIKERQAFLGELQLQLKSQAFMVKMTSENYKSYKNDLLPLIKKSYDLGETSVIEYLLSRQKLYTLNQELYASKKVYYQTLFRLYTLSETKDNK